MVRREWRTRIRFSPETREIRPEFKNKTDKKAAMEEKLIKTVELENGLALEVFDASRKIADKGEFQAGADPKASRTVEGDIWMVSIVGKINVPVEKAYFKDSGSSVMTHEAVIEILGETVPYEKRVERHLVHESEKDQIFTQALDEFMNGLVRYMAHPEFPKKFIYKRYEEETSPEALHRKALAQEQ